MTTSVSSVEQLDEVGWKVLIFYYYLNARVILIKWCINTYGKHLMANRYGKPHGKHQVKTEKKKLNSVK